MKTLLLCVAVVVMLFHSALAQPELPDMPEMPEMPEMPDSPFELYAIDDADLYDMNTFQLYGSGDVFSSGGTVNLGKKGSFQMPAPLAMVRQAPRYETLPVETQKTQYLQPVVQTQYIDQDIIQPKTIVQPVLQQRLVEQPIIRTRLIKQPIHRTIIRQNVIRPHLITQTRIVPELHTQDVIQPKIIKQDVVKQTFGEDVQQNKPVTETPTVQGKSAERLYGQY